MMPIDKTNEQTTVSALSTDAPGSCQPVPPVVARTVVAPFAEANAAMAQCTAGHTMRAAVDSLREHFVATALSNTSEDSHFLAESLDEDEGRLLVTGATKRGRDSDDSDNDGDEGINDGTTRALLHNIVSVADEVIEARRMATAELRFRQPLILAVQRLKALPEDQSGFKPTEEQVAAVEFFLNDIRYVRAIIHEAQPKYKMWTYHVVEAVVAGLRIYSCYMYSETSDADPETDIKFAPVDTKPAVLSNEGVHWCKGKDLTGEAAHNALPNTSPLKALSPQTLELLCKVATCTMGLLHHEEWEPDSSDPLYVSLFTGTEPKMESQESSTAMQSLENITGMSPEIAALLHLR